MARWVTQVVRPGVSICAAETQTDELCQAVGRETAMVVEAPHGLATDEAERPFEFLQCQFLKHSGILTFRNRFRQAQPEGFDKLNLKVPRTTEAAPSHPGLCWAELPPGSVRSQARPLSPAGRDPDAAGRRTSRGRWAVYTACRRPRGTPGTRLPGRGRAATAGRKEST